MQGSGVRGLLSDKHGALKMPCFVRHIAAYGETDLLHTAVCNSFKEPASENKHLLPHALSEAFEESAKQLLMPGRALSAHRRRRSPHRRS